MLRTVLAAAVVYAFGTPAFDGHRPASLDKPLQIFYTEINIAGGTAKRALAVLGDGSMKRYVEVFIGRLGAALHAKENQR